jgi:hypothetical protein
MRPDAKKRSTATRATRLAIAIVGMVAVLAAVPALAAPPTQPTVDSTSPASPANENHPKVIGTAPSGTTVNLYTDAACTEPAQDGAGTGDASGTDTEFASPGIAVTVADDSTTTFYATATDSTPETSGCSTTFVTYVEDSTAPAVPTVDSTDPASPANENNPKVIGTAPSDTTVNLYTDAACTQAAQDGAGTGDASGTDAEFASPGIAVTVADDSSTTFYATATDAVGNVSECSTTSVTYIEDSSSEPPAFTGTNPGSPANETSPKLLGTAEAGSTVKIYTSADCSGTELASGPESDFSSTGITVPVADNSTTTFHATATDAVGNVSECSTVTITYVEDSTAPASPAVGAILPAGPANDNTPEVTGSGEAGSTIRLYAGDCSGTPLATGSEAEFASGGLTAAVADNSTTSFRATATDAAGNTSACSTSSATYVEDSVAPNTRVTFAPLGKTRDRTPTFLFGAMGEDDNVSFACSLDEGPFKRCGSPKTYRRLSLKHHVFTVRAVDEAGNADPSPVRRGFRVVRRHRHR